MTGTFCVMLVVGWLSRLAWRDALSPAVEAIKGQRLRGKSVFKSVKPERTIKQSKTFHHPQCVVANRFSKSSTMCALSDGFISRMGKYVFLNIINQWLEIVDIVGIDSACCNTHTRNSFTKLILKHGYLCSGIMRVLKLNDEFAHWVLTKGFRFDTMHWPLNGFSTASIKVLSQHSVTVASIIVTRCTEKGMKSLDYFLSHS